MGFEVVGCGWGFVVFFEGFFGNYFFLDDGGNVVKRKIKGRIWRWEWIK